MQAGGQTGHSLAQGKEQSKYILKETLLCINEF